MALFSHIPFFVEAWDSKTKHLSRHEKGLYLDLLILMWQTPGCSVPDDEAWLHRRLIIKEKDGDQIETEMLRRILSDFCTLDNGRIYQARLRKEYEYCISQSKKRKGKKNKGSPPNPNANQNPGLDSLPTPTPTPTVEDKEPDGSLSSAHAKANGHDKSSRGKRLPTDWQPTAEDREFAESLGLNPDDITPEFRDYWCAVPGARGTKLDWSRTFKNRCRDIAARRGNPTSASRGGRQGSSGIVAAFARAAAKAS